MKGGRGKGLGEGDNVHVVLMVLKKSHNDLHAPIPEDLHTLEDHQSKHDNISHLNSHIVNIKSNNKKV